MKELFLFLYVSFFLQVHAMENNEKYLLNEFKLVLSDDDGEIYFRKNFKDLVAEIPKLNSKVTTSLNNEENKIFPKLGINPICTINTSDSLKKLLVAVNSENLQQTVSLLKTTTDDELNASAGEAPADNEKWGWDDEGIPGFTPLTLAVHKNNFKIMEDLINAGAKINKLDNFGLSPLMHAITDGNYYMVQKLVGLNANQIQSNRNKTFTAYRLAIKMQERPENTEANQNIRNFIKNFNYLLFKKSKGTKKYTPKTRGTKPIDKSSARRGKFQSH